MPLSFTILRGRSNNAPFCVSAAKRGEIFKDALLIIGAYTSSFRVHCAKKSCAKDSENLANSSVSRLFEVENLGISHRAALLRADMHLGFRSHREGDKKSY